MKKMMEMDNYHKFENEVNEIMTQLGSGIDPHLVDENEELDE